MPLPIARFLNIRQAYGPSISHDGRRLVFISNITGVPQVWSMPAGGGWPDPLTFEADRVSMAACSPAGPVLIFARDEGGNENAQLFVLNEEGGGERRLTSDTCAMHIFGNWAPDGKSFAFAANRRDRARYDIYLQSLEAGEARMVWQNDEPGYLWPQSFSPDGARLLVSRARGSMDHDLYELALSGEAAATARHLTPHSGQARYKAAAYSADGQSVYLTSDIGRDTCAPMRLQLDDLSIKLLADPDAEVDEVAVSPDGRWLAWAENVDGAHALKRMDLQTGQVAQAPGLPLGALVTPPADFDSRGLGFAPSEALLALTLSTPTGTADIWLWDVAAGETRQVTHSSHGDIPAGIMIEPELVRFASFDGRQIPAWYYPAAGREAGQPGPAVVYVHGGPEGQTMALLYPILQFLAHHGFAVLAPNVRGSSGYGRAYLDLDNVEKRMDSVADLAYGARWLGERPEIDPARIAVYGGSYGGFMVLSALCTYPELWAAGVELVGIANFVTFLENTGAYRRSAREAEYGSLARDRALLERISPIHQVDKIRAPLLVIHGANDPRVPLSEAEQVVAALRARDVPVELLVYADEGHGLVKLANKLDAYPRMLEFLEEHLKG